MILEDEFSQTNNFILSVIFNQIINLYSKYGPKGSALHCEELLNRMLMLAAEGNSQVVPDVR
jgi:hypothetical protein